MCNYPEESYSGHVEETRIQPQHAPDLKKTNEAIDKCVDELMETSNVDISLMMDDYKESLAEKAKCPMAEAEDQKIEDMCSARRIIPDEQSSGGQRIDTQFSAQEESAIMAEVDKRVAEISNQLHAEYAEKEKELVDHVDKTSNEYYKQLIEEQRQSLNAYYTALWSCWNYIPDDMKAKFGGTEYVKKYAAIAENELNHAHLNHELNYNASQLVESIGKVYKETGHISDEDLEKLATDPNMMTEFILKYVPMAERSKFELTLQALKEQHPEMQWNVQALNIEDGGTMNFCGLPNMSDTVLSSSNEKVCTVADVYETQLKHYKEANDSMQIGTTLDPKNVSYWDAKIPSQQDQRKVAMQCTKSDVDALSASQPAERMLSKNMLDDLPKSMVDKIVTISNEYWSHESDGEVFDLVYSYMSRYINILADFSACTESSDKPFLVLKYRNSGLGAIQYKRIFRTGEEFLTAGSNAKRLYAWLAMVIDAFYNK